MNTMKIAKSENHGGDDVNNLKQPYLSGAYIRSFVKQLASSRSSMREKEPDLDPPPTNAQRQQQQQHQIPPLKHKKQVRRRLQTRKPYQEKLLNMAEARREIVTALKLHRAAMKQQQQEIIQSHPDFQTEQTSRRNPRIYASNADVHFCSWPAPTAPPPPPPPPVFLENLDFALPSQALGLNLNLHDFTNSSIYLSSSPSSSSSSPPPPQPPLEIQPGFEFLDCVGIGGEEEREEEIVGSPFDEVMEFPPWLNANESCFQNVDDQDFFQVSVLPCMDIEEIEGMDGDWLA